MILLWGDFADRPLNSVMGSLKENTSADLVVVDQKRSSEIEIEMKVSDGISGYIQIGDRYYSLADITSAYLRPYGGSGPDDGTSDASTGHDLCRHGLELEQVLTSWVDMTPALVINRFAAMASNGSKPYQASIIKKYGFKTPATIISNTPDEVRDFCRRQGQVIYKSISGVRSIVARLTREKMKHIDDIIWAPTQFQQYVRGTDIRVHVIGGKTICSEIISDADDYRYAARTGNDLKISACDIPAEQKIKCIELVKDLGLAVGGVDLRLTPDGEWYCFEVNPSPGFTYYQSHTGQDIAAEIADLLVHPSGN